MDIAQTENTISNLKHSNAWRERLAAALAPSPGEWEFTGEVGEDDTGMAKCACGHSIKYLFNLERKRDGKKVIVGSSCIEHYGEAAPELVESIKKAVEELKAKLAEDKKKAKAAAAEIEVYKIEVEWEALYQKGHNLYMSYRNDDRKAPYALWFLFGSSYGRVKRYPKEYKTARGYINWYKNSIKTLTTCYKRDGYLVENGE